MKLETIHYHLLNMLDTSEQQNGPKYNQTFMKYRSKVLHTFWVLIGKQVQIYIHMNIIKNYIKQSENPPQS